MVWEHQILIKIKNISYHLGTELRCFICLFGIHHLVDVMSAAKNSVHEPKVFLLIASLFLKRPYFF